MDHNSITLEDLNKNFEYFKACKELDAIDDIDVLRDISKAYMKLYLKQQEVVSDMMKPKT